MENIFANRLSSILWQRGMTQKELAKKAGVTNSAISHYINAVQYPHSTVLLLIADALDVSMDYLFGRTDNPQILKSKEVMR